MDIDAINVLVVRGLYPEQEAQLLMAASVSSPSTGLICCHFTLRLDFHPIPQLNLETYWWDTAFQDKHNFCMCPVGRRSRFSDAEPHRVQWGCAVWSKNWNAISFRDRNKTPLPTLLDIQENDLWFYCFAVSDGLTSARNLLRYLLGLSSMTICKALTV